MKYCSQVEYDEKNVQDVLTLLREHVKQHVISVRQGNSPTDPRLIVGLA